MKKLKTLIVISLLIISCKKDSSVSSINILVNSSFETNLNQPDYSGWTGTAYIIDTAGNIFDPIVQDAPSGGGLWSLQLEPGWIPSEGYSETHISGLSGTHTIELSAWMKSINWTGSISLEHWRNGQKIKYKTIADNPSQWKQITLIDTLTLLMTDTITVHLSAGWTEVASGRVLYDLVKLLTTKQQ